MDLSQLTGSGCRRLHKQFSHRVDGGIKSARCCMVIRRAWPSSKAENRSEQVEHNFPYERRIQTAMFGLLNRFKTRVREAMLNGGHAHAGPGQADAASKRVTRTGDKQMREPIEEHVYIHVYLYSRLPCLKASLVTVTGQLGSPAGCLGGMCVEMPLWNSFMKKSKTWRQLHRSLPLVPIQKPASWCDVVVDIGDTSESVSLILNVGKSEVSS